MPYGVQLFPIVKYLDIVAGRVPKIISHMDGTQTVAMEKCGRLRPLTRLVAILHLVNVGYGVKGCFDKSVWVRVPLATLWVVGMTRPL